MRHSVYGKKLGRNKNERTALFKSLVSSLILSESIQITKPRAQAIKGLVDKIINQAKNPDTRRLVSQFLTRKEVSEKLVKDLVPKLKNRKSGYTSVIKMGFRKGDGALMVRMSLILDEEGSHFVKASNSAKALLDESRDKSEKSDKSDEIGKLEESELAVTVKEENIEKEAKMKKVGASKKKV